MGQVQGTLPVLHPWSWGSGWQQHGSWGVLSLLHSFLLNEDFSHPCYCYSLAGIRRDVPKAGDTRSVSQAVPKLLSRWFIKLPLSSKEERLTQIS